MTTTRKWLRLPVIAATMILGWREAGYASPPLPYLHEVFSRVVVGKNSQGTYTYTYKVMNGSRSVGDLTRFWVSIEHPSDGVSLRSDGLNDAPHHVIGRGGTELPGVKQIVPVGFPAFPDGWLAGPTSRGAAKWGVGSDSVPRLSPGSSIGNFVLTSWGIPTIRPFHAYPDFDRRLLDFYPDVDMVSDEEAERIRVQLEKDREMITFKGKTIGPTAPPKVFDPVKYVEYMESLRSQSFDLHWIKDSYTASESGAKLSAISSQLSGITENKIPLSKGTKILELGAQFLQFVESNSCKEFDCSESRPLTAESYALLFYNMDYFLSQVRLACGIAEPSAPPPSPVPKRKK